MQYLWSCPAGNVPNDGLSKEACYPAKWSSQPFLSLSKSSPEGNTAEPDSAWESPLKGRTLIIFPLTCVLFCLFVSLANQKAETFQLSVTAANHQFDQGGIFQIVVKSASPIKEIEAEFDGKKLNFYSTTDNSTWACLAGIDLEARAGEHPLEGRLLFTNNHSQEIHRTLRILPRKFPEQRITVDEKYVTLNPADQARAEEESKKLEALWKTISPDRYWSGRFLRPIESQLTSGFGRRRIVNNQPRSPHAGVDFKADSGTPIKAANSGKVVLSQNLFFSGNTIVIDHGLGLYTYYAHCSVLNVKEGEKVKKGQIVGAVGSTGRATGPHLHWSCRLDGARVDPLWLTTALLGE